MEEVGWGVEVWEVAAMAVEVPARARAVADAVVEERMAVAVKGAMVEEEKVASAVAMVERTVGLEVEAQAAAAVLEKVTRAAAAVEKRVG